MLRLLDAPINIQQSWSMDTNSHKSAEVMFSGLSWMSTGEAVEI